MKVAVFGATSEIAKDLILSFADNADYALTLFARRPEAVRSWLVGEELSNRYLVRQFDEFEITQEFDAILNFVGIGNPAQAVQMGYSILDITYQFDTVALNYLQEHPTCRYVFMSSGAAYGDSFKDPVNEKSYSSFPINQLKPQDWYGLAKLYAEARHRSTPWPIVDVRIFNYFSHTQSLEANFFITEVIKAISNKKVLITSPDNIMRDYLGSQDFSSLIKTILDMPPFNGALDCYSTSPVDKRTILSTFKELFGLEYQIVMKEIGVSGTGSKERYYSVNRAAGVHGYVPKFSSIDLLVQEAKKLLSLKKIL
jgi:nucleoside-diphosphate-sugar epimerase